MGFKFGDFPQAEKYYAEAITLPLFATLSSEQQNFIAEVLKKVLES